jgi:DNA-binding response OmpR family regulator
VRPRVLIVEDEDAIREILIEFLQSQGYAGEGAGTAVAGMSAARERRPDVVLLDINLPGAVSGLDVVTTLARESPVIVISGTHDSELARAALRRGAFDYITKPFDLVRVAAVVASAVKQQKGPRRAPFTPNDDCAG